MILQFFTCIPFSYTSTKMDNNINRNFISVSLQNQMKYITNLKKNIMMRQ